MRKTSLRLAIAIALMVSAAAQAASLLNVSYDPTRELYRAINDAFVQTPEGARAPTSSSRTADRARSRVR